MVVNKITEKVVESKQFKGDILITDPCYIIKKVDESTRPKWEDYFTYNNMTEYPDYDGQYSKQYMEEIQIHDKVYAEWYTNYPDDWDKCNCGYNCERLGIRNYITSDNIYEVKNQFLANCFTIPEGFNIAELGDLNFRLVWDIKDGYDFVGYLNNDNVVVTVKEITFNSPQQILFMNSNIIDMKD